MVNEREMVLYIERRMRRETQPPDTQILLLATYATINCRVLCVHTSLLMSIVTAHAVEHLGGHLQGYGYESIYACRALKYGNAPWSAKSHLSAARPFSREHKVHRDREQRIHIRTNVSPHLPASIIPRSCRHRRDRCGCMTESLLS